jgi:multidrug efflux pump subunit AcrA (membrane-fusion protein)
MVGLDPTAGIDPAVREVTRTRLFAERAMFTAQRMPFLLRAQIELLTAQVLDQQQVTNALTSAERLSHAAESASQTAAQLPDRLAAERKAILAELESQEGKLRELSAEVSRTLAAGEKMSTSLNTTLITFDALMKRFGVGEPSEKPADTNSPPFNILDYAKTAEQIAVMAQQLDVLLKDASGTVDSPALDKRIASLDATAKRARDDAKALLNHAFLLGAALIGLCFGAALGYRCLAAGRSAAPTSGPVGKSN